MGLAADTFYSLRRLARRPGFAISASLTLAIGIGANVGLFALANGVLLKKAPVSHLDALVGVTISNEGTVRPDAGLLPSRFRYLESRQPKSVIDLTTVHQQSAAVVYRGSAVATLAEAIGGPYFGLFGVRPYLGRLLTAADTRPESCCSAVIGFSLWQRLFGSDPSAVGSVIQIGGHDFLVVGVTEKGFRGVTFPTLFTAEVWIPDGVLTPLDDRHPTRVFGQLASGASFSGANAEIRTIGENIDPTDHEVGLALLEGQRAMIPSEALTLGFAFGAALLGLSGLVLFIACVNLTNLILVRTANRESELAIRLACGATPERLYRLILVENLIVATAGSALGLLLATWLGRVVASASVVELGGLLMQPDTTPDGRVFVYLLAVVVCVTALVTAGPVALLAGTGPGRTLAESGFSSLGPRQTRRRRVLVAAQLCASVILLTMASVVLRSALAGLDVDPIFKVAGIGIGQLDLTLNKLDSKKGLEFYRTLLQTAQQAGVAKAALTSGLPSGTGGANGRLQAADSGQVANIRSLIVSDAFFGALDIRLQRGHTFGPIDATAPTEGIVVNESLATDLWAGNAIGKKAQLVGSQDRLEVIGVVADTSGTNRGATHERYVFLSQARRYDPRLALIVRPTTPGTNSVQQVRDLVKLTDETVPVFDVKTLAEAVSTGAATEMTAARVLSGLGLAGLVMAVIGLFGVMAYSVSSRTREFGVRRALGASPWDVYRMILSEGIKLVGLGLAPGWVVALAAARLTAHFHIGVAYDWISLVMVPLALLIVAGVAIVLSARRAASSELQAALRCQ